MEKAREGGGDNGRKLGWILNFSQVTDFIIFEKVNAGEGGNDGGRARSIFFCTLVLGKQEEKVLFPPSFPLSLSPSATMHRLATFSRGIYSRE